MYFGSNSLTRNVDEKIVNQHLFLLKKRKLHFYNLFKKRLRWFLSNVLEICLLGSSTIRYTMVFFPILYSVVSLDSPALFPSIAYTYVLCTPCPTLDAHTHIQPPLYSPRHMPAISTLFPGATSTDQEPSWPSLSCSPYPSAHEQVKEEKRNPNFACTSETVFLSDEPPLLAFHAPCHSPSFGPLPITYRSSSLFSMLNSSNTYPSSWSTVK